MPGSDGPNRQAGPLCPFVWNIRSPRTASTVFSRTGQNHLHRLHGNYSGKFRFDQRTAILFSLRERVKIIGGHTCLVHSEICDLNESLTLAHGGLYAHRLDSSSTFQPVCTQKGA